MQSQTEKKQILKKFFDEIWPVKFSHLEPVFTDSTYMHVREETELSFMVLLDALNAMDGVWSVNRIAAKVVELDFQHLLQRKPKTPQVQVVEQPQQPDPRLSIPHRDRYPRLNSIEACIRFVRNAKGIPAGDLAVINEILAYVKLHDMHETEALELEKVESAKVVIPTNREIDEARALVAALKVNNIGSVRSDVGGGRWTQLLKTQEKLNQQINTMARNGAKGSEILTHIRAAIADLQSSSIR